MPREQIQARTLFEGALRRSTVVQGICRLRGLLERSSVGPGVTHQRAKQGGRATRLVAGSNSGGGFVLARGVGEALLDAPRAGAVQVDLQATIVPRN